MESIPVGPFFKSLPKIELHAHLNGSISEETSNKLVTKKWKRDGEQPDVTILKKWKKFVKDGIVMPRGTKHVFEAFHHLVDDEEAVAMVTKDIINEFAIDGVRYLELRSTPRDEPRTGMTKRSYIEAVLSAIRHSQDVGINIIVRFLVSINRTNSLETAKETIMLAKEYLMSSNGVVLGVDLSGDPTLGDGREFIPLLKEARDAGLKLTIHVAEASPIPHESLPLIEVPADRIGHGIFLNPDMGGNEEMVVAVTHRQIPLELCLTSNFTNKRVSSYALHPFKFWYDKGHPVVLCTDDKGVFFSDLSREYQVAASVFNLSQQQMWELSYHSIDCIFADENIKSELRQLWIAEKSNLQL